jgi:two-component sensor histidine kinase
MFGDNAAVAPRRRRVTWKYRLAPNVDSIGQARRCVRHALERLTDADTVDRLELIVSELVTNAVRHGPGELITLRLAMEPDGTVAGQVEDQGSGIVAIRDQPAEGGLGLVVVDQLTSAWGVHPETTDVWFRLEAA